MLMLFDTLAIAGLGLIGGSIARDARQRGLAGRIIAFGRSAARLEHARHMGLIDAGYTEFGDAIAAADLVIIGTPVRIIAAQARACMPGMRPGAILCDVGSVKGQVVRDIESCAPPHVHFIGAHPIAGTENSGFESSVSGLFEERICVLTPTPHTDAAALQRLGQFWEALGSRVITMDTQTHDRMFAAISHLPHMVAFALVNAISGMQGFEGDILQYSAGGFRDFTRIAASDPVMWRDIALMNRECILQSIDCMEQSLGAIKAAVAAGDADTIETLFRKSRDTRRSL